MSAVNVVVNTQRACVLTDSSLYDAKGVIIGFERKAFPVDSWNGVVTGRGNCWGLSFVRDLAESFVSFDEFLARSAAVIEREHRDAIETGGLAGQTMIELHAIGWSERRDRPEAYVLRSPSAFLDADEPPYIWQEIEEGIFHCHHATHRELWQLHRLGAQEGVDWTPEGFDPVRHGVPLMEMQRRAPSDARAGLDVAGKHVIGGEMWLTVVDREGVRQGVIHRWHADRPGEPIRPDPLDEASLPRIPPAEWPDTFERFELFMQLRLINPATLKVDMAKAQRVTAREQKKQRRAAEKQARKAHARV